ncbi:hypothetical protein [Rhizobium leguminosarum]
MLKHQAMQPPVSRAADENAYAKPAGATAFPVDALMTASKPSEFTYKTGICRDFRHTPALAQCHCAPRHRFMAGVTFIRFP